MNKLHTCKQRKINNEIREKEGHPVIEIKPNMNNEF